MLKKDVLKEVFEQPVRFGCACVKGAEGRILDAGVHAPGGWQVGRRLVLSLLGGFAEVTLDQMQAGEQMLPTLDVYLDNTVQAARNIKKDGNGVVSADGSDYAFCRTDDAEMNDAEMNDDAAAKASAAANGKKLLLAKETSLTVCLYDAGMALPVAVQGLLDAGFCAEEIYWGHSAGPVAPLRQAQARKAGLVVGLWLRCGDEELRQYTAAWQGDGELRLHNLRTGHTFMAGRVDEEALARCLE